MGTSNVDSKRNFYSFFYAEHTRVIYFARIMYVFHLYGGRPVPAVVSIDKAWHDRGMVRGPLKMGVHCTLHGCNFERVPYSVVDFMGAPLSYSLLFVKKETSKHSTRRHCQVESLVFPLRRYAHCWCVVFFIGNYERWSILARKREPYASRRAFTLT